MAPEPTPSSRSLRGLDAFAFFLADVQTGWGPFVAAYLTSKSWTQLDIGLILTVGTLAGIAMQIPIGALVDRVAAKRLLAAGRANERAVGGSMRWPASDATDRC